MPEPKKRLSSRTHPKSVATSMKYKRNEESAVVSDADESYSISTAERPLMRQTTFLTPDAHPHCLSRWQTPPSPTNPAPLRHSAPLAPTYSPSASSYLSHESAYRDCYRCPLRATRLPS